MKSGTEQWLTEKIGNLNTGFVFGFRVCTPVCRNIRECTQAGVGTYVWKPEISLGWNPSVTVPLHFETGPFTGTETH